MQIYFNIVQKKRSKVHYALYGILAIIFICLIVSIICDEGYNPPHIRTIIIGILMLVVGAISVIRSYLRKEFIKIGQIRFNSNEISINSNSDLQVFPISEIEHLRFIINDTADDNYALTSWRNKEGINNFVEFTDKSGSNHNYRIYLEGVSSLKILNIFLSSWGNQSFELAGNRRIDGY